MITYIAEGYLRRWPWRQEDQFQRWLRCWDGRWWGLLVSSIAVVLGGDRFRIQFRSRYFLTGYRAALVGGVQDDPQFPGSRIELVCVWVAITKYHRLGTLNTKNLFSHSPGGWKSKVRVSTVLVSSETSRWLAHGCLLPLSSRGTFSLGVYPCCLFMCPISLSYKPTITLD